jgi:hypothetical protein
MRGAIPPLAHTSVSQSVTQSVVLESSLSGTHDQILVVVKIFAVSCHGASSPSGGRVSCNRSQPLSMSSDIYISIF